MQAERSLGNTKENPSVGCVIVKNNNVISSGYTSHNGRPHAEINAIKGSKVSVKNSSMYITLEPCSHYGKTAPCINKIINKKVKKVFFSVNDPDPRSYKKSIKFLKKKNIKTNSGILSSRINHFYKSYFLYKSNDLPFVTLKLAISKDYMTIDKKKRWITNLYSRSRVHLMRSNHDCIITSYKTINTDNPLLNCRINGLEKNSPIIIILDKNLKTKINSKIVNNKKNKTIIFYNKFNAQKINTFKKNGIKIIKTSLNSHNNLDLTKILIKTKKLGFSRIFVESGKNLSTSFLKNNLVNEFKLFISNNKLKKNGTGSFKKYFTTYLKNKKSILDKVYLFDEKLISYKIK